MAKKFYCVIQGRAPAPAICSSWDLTKSLVNGFSNAEYVGFITLDDATAHMRDRGHHQYNKIGFDTDTQQGFKVAQEPQDVKPIRQTGGVSGRNQPRQEKAADHPIGQREEYEVQGQCTTLELRTEFARKASLAPGEIKVTLRELAGSQC
ncbi:hypothetical protein BX600DRAFT_45722 [Xylariales sp. PMI_506]|nr:hypothetical protein BX600DRAFT_45722 [Xylariales sp. PMI_506]